jgi:hypothetical protein
MMFCSQPGKGAAVQPRLLMHPAMWGTAQWLQAFAGVHCPALFTQLHCTVSVAGTIHPPGMLLAVSPYACVYMCVQHSNTEVLRGPLWPCTAVWLHGHQVNLCTTLVAVLLLVSWVQLAPTHLHQPLSTPRRQVPHALAPLSTA